MALQYISCARDDNRGELITRNFLMSSLADTEGVLLSNYQLFVNNGSRECDFVLFNRYGIWILEVKIWRGPIMIDQVNWQRDDGFIQHSPLINVETKAKILASVVKNAGFKNISVVGLVVLAHPGAELEDAGNMKSREPRADKIFRLDTRLIYTLNGRKYLYNTNNIELNRALIQKIVSKLLPRTIVPEQEHIGNSYRIMYDLGPGPNEVFHMYQVMHVNIPGRYARAKKYYTSTVYSTGELRDALHRFRRDMQALVKMEYHPNIVKVYDYQPDRDSSDIYWLLLEWIKGMTLQDRLDSGPTISFQEQLHILYAVLDALDCCHSNGILHRNLTPSCIYLANDGTVKIGDFDFAYVPDLPSMDQPLPVKTNRYMARELRINARTADARSDLYALGATWYDMVVGPEPGRAIDLSRLEETELPYDARDLLVRLLDPDPNERPRNAKAVKRWLETAL